MCVSAACASLCCLDRENGPMMLELEGLRVAGDFVGFMQRLIMLKTLFSIEGLVSALWGEVIVLLPMLAAEVLSIKWCVPLLALAKPERDHAVAAFAGL